MRRTRMRRKRTGRGGIRAGKRGGYGAEEKEDERKGNTRNRRKNERRRGRKRQRRRRGRERQGNEEKEVSVKR